MSTPTKPERVEAGQRRKANANAGDLIREHVFTIVEPWTAPFGSGWKYRYDGRPGSFYRDEAGILAQSTLIAPAPATPGTATVTPGPTHRQCGVCKGEFPATDWGSYSLAELPQQQVDEHVARWIAEGRHLGGVYDVPEAWTP